MSTSVLSQASAFNPGADLWIVPHLDKSHWTAQLDWYLNFQISKASRRESPHTSDFVNQVVATTGLDKFQYSVPENAPLMISTEKLLPNKWVVVIPWNKNMGEWSSTISKIWGDLKEPSLRVFLPPGLSSSNFQQAWDQHHNLQDFTVVLD